MTHCIKKLSCILVDDEPHAIESLELILDLFEDVTVLATLTSAVDLSSAILEKQPDVVFIDIKMPGLNGLDATKLIMPMFPEVKFVFVSGHKDHLHDALRVSAFDFLVKPIGIKELELVLQRVSAAIKNLPDEKRKIKVTTKQEVVFLKSEEILLLHASGRYTEIYSTSGDKYISSYNLGKYEGEITGDNFVRVGRHAIINKDYLFKLNNKTRLLTLKAGEVERTVKLGNVARSELD